MLIELFGHLTFTLIALSFLVRQMFLLRALSILAALASIAYNFSVAEQPLWLVINWNLVFILVNLVQIGRMAWERRDITLSPEALALHESHFQRLAPAEFLRLLKLARWEAAEAGTRLAQAGEPLARVLLMRQGQASVIAAGREIDTIEPGDFVGEGGLIGRAPASASVHLSQASSWLSWDISELEVLLAREPQLRGAIQVLVAQDLARKLTRQDTSRPALA